MGEAARARTRGEYRRDLQASIVSKSTGTLGPLTLSVQWSGTTLALPRNDVRTGLFAVRVGMTLRSTPVRKTAAVVLAVSFGITVTVCAALASGGGKIKLDAENAQLTIKAGETTVTVSSADGEMQLGAGTYTPTALIITRRQVKEEGGKKEESQWQLSAAGKWGGLSEIKVTEGQTTAVKLGEPLTLRAEVGKSSDGRTFGLQIAGMTGEVYTNYATKDGDPAISVVPKITILDAAGKVMGSGSFTFG
jgi:hypothetical protein